jgi:Putative lumazine-binding
MAVAVLLAPVGCSIGADEEPKPVTGAAKQIAMTVEQLQRAVAARDYAAICDELFTKTARQRAGGDECETQMRSAAEDVRRPTIRIEQIAVKDDRAVVTVATTATGQARVTDAMELRKETDGWRIEALSD